MSYLSNSWLPTKAFFNQESESYFCPYIKKYFDISWKFTVFNNKSSPYCLVRCEMTGFGYKSEGFGDDLRSFTAFIKAFSEAWERLWLKRLSKEQVLIENKYESSNGFASGRTTAEAVRSSKNELIERFVFLSCWERFELWQNVKLTSLTTKFLKILFDTRGFKLRFYNIPTNVGTLLVGCSQKRGLYFDSVLTTTKDYKECEVKLMGSLFRSFWKEEIFFEEEPISLNDLRSSKVISDHLRFYLNQESHKVIDEIEYIDKKNNKFNIFEEDKIESTVITEVTKFPAVAVSKNKFWPDIKWGEKYMKEFKGKWPHPLD